jgi:hypothetical protein
MSYWCPKNEKVKREWAANRLKAYHGSEMHFMRALCQRTLAKEGFFINLYYDKYDLKGNKTRKALADEAIVIRSPLFHNEKIKMPTIHDKRIIDSVKSTNEHTVLSFSGELEIIYALEAESYLFQKYRNQKKSGFTVPQISILKLLKDDVIVEQNGQLHPEENLETKGYWSWELMAESLPLDYDPAEDLRIVKPHLR